MLKAATDKLPPGCKCCNKTDTAPAWRNAQSDACHLPTFAQLLLRAFLRFCPFDMNRYLQTFKFSDQPSGHQDVSGRRSAPWLQSALAAGRSPRVLQVLAMGSVLGLVAVFHTVVTQAVHQSGLRRQAAAAQSQAAWRCKQLPSMTALQACQQALPAQPDNTSQ